MHTEASSLCSLTNIPRFMNRTRGQVMNNAGPSRHTSGLKGAHALTTSLPPTYKHVTHKHIHTTHIHTYHRSTFRPSINQYRPSREGSASAARRLYEGARKPAPNILSSEERELLECTFKPAINKSRPPDSARSSAPCTPAAANKSSASTSWADTKTRGSAARLQSP
jgi:hypothetical protein